MQLTSSNISAKKMIKTIKLALLQKFGLYRIKVVEGNLLLCGEVRSTEGLYTTYVLLMLLPFCRPFADWQHSLSVTFILKPSVRFHNSH